ncbi:MAG TPA: 30S ribosomal protein S20 [Candidatus Paceibacterota bacterium]|nr:30S ribosomal protein S20 [Candidatus Paceibacterota bacterium]
MPITKSAKKALRQSKTRRARNLKRKNAYKEALKQYRKLVMAGNLKEAKELLPKVYQTLDKAAKTGVIKPNKAARLKSSSILAIAKNA